MKFDVCLLLQVGLAGAFVIAARADEGVCGLDGLSHYQHGDAIITALLPLHTNADCTKVGLAEVQVAEAITMAVTRLNQVHFLPGVTLGVRVMDTCGDVGRGVRMALKTLLDDDSCHQPALTLALLGPSEGEAASAIGRVTKGLEVPVMSPVPRLVAAPDTIGLMEASPELATKAIVQVLAGAGVRGVSVAHTDDEEGRVLAEWFIAVALDGYRCVEAVVAVDDPVEASRRLRDGPGTVVVLGTRHAVLKAARYLGGPAGSADLLVLLDTAGPVPQAELEGVVVPVLLLNQVIPEVPSFHTYMARDLGYDDHLRREYVAAVSECESCPDLDLGYDRRVAGAVATVLRVAQALRDAHATLCHHTRGLCQVLSSLSLALWTDLLTEASTSALAALTFPDAQLEGLADGDPRYTVHLLQPANGTRQVGHADDISAVLGEIDIREPRCGVKCSCPTPSPPTTQTPSYPATTPSPQTTTWPSYSPADPTIPTIITTTTHTPSGGLDIFSDGGLWFKNAWPSAGLPENLSQSEMTVYVIAFFLLLVLFLTSTIACLYAINKPPRRD